MLWAYTRPNNAVAFQVVEIAGETGQARARGIRQCAAWGVEVSRLRRRDRADLGAFTMGGNRQRRTRQGGAAAAPERTTVRMEPQAEVSGASSKTTAALYARLRVEMHGAVRNWMRGEAEPGAPRRLALPTAYRKRAAPPKRRGP